MSSTTKLANRSNMRDDTKSVDIQVTVVRASNLPKSHKLQDSSHYVVLTICGKELKTTPCKGKVPEWKQDFTISADPLSRLRLQVYCGHKYGDDHIVGEAPDFSILDSSRDQDVIIALHKPGSSASARDRGSVTIRLRVDLTFRHFGAVSGTETRTGPRTVQDLARIGVVTTLLQTDLDRFGITPQWSSLLTSLATLVSLAGNIAELDPKAKIALGAVTFAFEVFMKQVARDNKVAGLVGTMASLYDFLQDANPLEKIRSYEKTVERLVRQTAECAYFIAEYIKTSAFAQRALVNITSNADTMIAAYESSFGELKIEFIMGSTLQTALTTVRILEKVENIANLINLDRLPYIAGASWDPSRISLPGTNALVIDDIIRWISGPTSAGSDHVEHIYLLVGAPSCGKSSVSQAIAQILHDQGRLGSAIFLARNVESRNCSSQIFSTMAYDLAAFHSKIEERISQAIRKAPGLPTAVIERQFQELILGTTQGLTIIGPVLIVIDGLDEIKDAQDRRRLLRLIVKESVRLPANFRMLITSRPEPEIEATFKMLHHHRRREMFFDDSGDTRDIHTHIAEMTSKLNTLVFGKYSIDTVREQLMQRAMGIHFWATTTCRFLMMASDGDATYFVDNLLSQHLPESPDDTMDHLYDAILQTTAREIHLTFESGWKVLFQALINGRCASIPVAKSYFHSPATLGCHPVDTLYEIGCILDTVDAEGSHVLMLHPAFEVFIANKRRYTDSQFCVDMNINYAATLCLPTLRVLNNHLSRNICRFEDASLLNSERLDKDERIRRFVPARLLYASGHWVDHLLETKDKDSEVLDQLREFLFKHLLHWIELSSLMEKLDTILVSLRRVDRWLTELDATNADLLAMTRSCVQFLEEFFNVISIAALHTYISALPLTPPETLLWQTYITESIPWVVLKKDEAWSCSRAWRGHESSINSVAFSPDGSKIVSGSRDETVRMWDAQRGVPVGKPMRGQSYWVESTVFSPDGLKIASGSLGGPVYQWDVHSGIGKPLYSYAGTVDCVVYSPDGLQLLSCGNSKTICIFNANTGKLIGEPLVGHQEAVCCVAFSPDGKLIASGSSDKTVRIWDAQTRHPVGEPLRGYTDTVLSVAWSPNRSLLVSGSRDNYIRLWDVHTREIIFKIQHRDLVRSVAFSPDGSRIASTCRDHAIRLWDVWTGRCIQELRGHDDGVASVAFSSNGQQIASGSSDLTIRIWAIERPRRITFTPCPKPASLKSTNIPSIPPGTCLPSFRFAARVSKDGWIRTSTGQRVAWVPIPGGKVTADASSDSLVVEG